MSTAKKLSGNEGQSLVETALITPLLVMLVLNVVNFGYFFWVTLNLTAASRTATLYAIEGSYTPSAANWPSAGPPTSMGTVSYLTQQDMTGPLAGVTAASIQICTPVNANSLGSGTNGTGASLKANCVTCSGSSCGAVSTGSIRVPNSDPEAPSFILNSVDIVYTFRPLIPGFAFTLPLRASGMCNATGTCTFSRHAEMRAM